MYLIRIISIERPIFNFVYIFYILFLTTNTIIQVALDEETVIQKSTTQKDKEKKGKEEKHIDQGEKRQGL